MAKVDAALVPLPGKTALVGTEIILMHPNLRRAEGERRYRRELATLVSASLGTERQAICRAAAMDQGLGPVGLQWTRLARFIRGPSVDAAIASDVGKVLAFLA